MSIRRVGGLTRLARMSFMAGSGSFAVGGSPEVTFVPGCAGAQRISAYELPVAGNGARSLNSSYSLTCPRVACPRVGTLVAFAAIASSFLYTMGTTKKASCQQEKGEKETGDEPHLRWDKFHEYMKEIDDVLPDYVDWEEAGAVTPSINQLKCGACTSIAAISSVESLYKMKTGKLVKFSPQQLVDCLGPSGCDGCSPREAYKYISKEGVILEADYPYTGISGPCRSKGLPVAARINGYFYVYVGGSERELMRAVAKQPVEVTICTTGSFVEYKGDGTLEPEDFSIGEHTVYNHSVLLVGYGVDDNGPYWKIKNSWGPKWGKRGFGKLRRGVKDPNGTGGMTRPGAFAFFPVMD